MSTDPAPRLPRRAIVLMGVLLCTAAAVGVAADRIYLMRTGQLMFPGGPISAPLTRPSPAQQNVIFEALRRELDLRAEQEPAVRRILNAQVSDLEALRNRVRPQLDSIFEITRDSLDLVLDATQRAKRDALLERLAPLTDSIGLRRPTTP